MNEGKAFNLFEQVTTLADNGTFLVGQVVDGEVKFRQLTKAGFIEQFGTPLAEYEFTPSLQFGDANIGLEYSSRSGKLLLSTNFAICNVSIVLSSKGSSTGTATIKGIRDVDPDFIIPATIQQCFAVDMNASLNSPIMAYLGQSYAGRNDTIKLVSFVSGNSTELTHADFTNTSVLEFTLLFNFTRS